MIDDFVCSPRKMVTPPKKKTAAQAAKNKKELPMAIVTLKPPEPADGIEYTPAEFMTIISHYEKWTPPRRAIIDAIFQRTYNPNKISKLYKIIDAIEMKYEEAAGATEVEEDSG